MAEWMTKSLEIDRLRETAFMLANVYEAEKLQQQQNNQLFNYKSIEWEVWGHVNCAFW